LRWARDARRAPGRISNQRIGVTSLREATGATPGDALARGGRIDSRSVVNGSRSHSPDGIFVGRVPDPPSAELARHGWSLSRRIEHQERRLAHGMSDLREAAVELTFLATGSRQHVFVRRDAREDEWVYKIPAAYGRIVPYSLYLQRRASSSYAHKKRTLSSRLLSPGASTDPVRLFETAPRSGLMGLGVTVLEQMYNVPPALRNRLFVAAFEWSSRRAFRTMLATMDYLARRGIAQVLLPYEVIPRAAAVLHVDGSSVPYQGPILVQRRSRFLGLVDFGSFEWREVIEAQHLLWRNGIALTDKEKLGPSNWASFEGHVRLGDTNSLTRDYRRAYRALDPKVLDERVGVVLERLGGRETTRALARQYFRVVREEINQRKLTELWARDLASKQVSNL
jgi:hypothetical protein